MRNFIFYANDLACPCCKNIGEVNRHMRILALLTLISRAIGKRVVVTSGYRCLAHNREIHGSPNSLHMATKAVDIACDNALELAMMLKVLLSTAGVMIRIYPNHVHVGINDIAGNAPTVTLGSYAK